MKTKPILFSTPMVQALLDGRKTQTRRIVKEEIYETTAQTGYNFLTIKGIGAIDEFIFKNPKVPYHVGDILWVRETWCEPNIHDGNEEDFYFKADAPSPTTLKGKYIAGVKWKPSIFMPKAACRLFLKVMSVRLEQLQEISEADAKAEGIQEFTKDGTVIKYAVTDSEPWAEMPRTAKEAFEALWRKINGSESWWENRWVWVVEFERTEMPEGFLS